MNWNILRHKGEAKNLERKKQSENTDLNEERMLKNMPGCTEVNMSPIEAQIHVYENPQNKT